MGSIFSVVIILFAVGSKLSEKRFDVKSARTRDAILKQGRATWKTLVQKEKHGELLQWLSDKNNYPEIQEHVRSVLKEIWHRDVEYTVHGDPSIDIRSVIYFVENGFLPSVYANKLNVIYSTGNFGFTKK